MVVEIDQLSRIATSQSSQQLPTVSEIAATIATAVEEQGATTTEIARNVQRAAHGTVLVASNIGEVSTGAAETGAASLQLLSSATALSTEGSKLRTEVDKFLSRVRAA